MRLLWYWSLIQSGVSIEAWILSHAHELYRTLAVRWFVYLVGWLADTC